MPRPGRRTVLAIGCAAALAASLGARAADEPYPSKTITIIVPYAAGSPPDTYTRLLAEKLREKTKQAVIIENRPGALTTVGMGYAARAKPDGYTIVYGSNSSLAAAPALFKSITYDPIKNFSAIAVTSESPMILISRPADAGLGFKGMLLLMQAEPGKHPIGGGAITQEVINRMLQTMGKIDQPYVRYSNPNINVDLLGGQTKMVISALGGIAPLVEAGKINVLAVTSDKRLTGKWNYIPTVAETIPGFQLTSWIGYWVPAGTPRPIINYLHGKITEILKDPDFSTRNEESGSLTVFMTPEQTDAFVRTEGPRWQKMIKSMGIEQQ